MTVWRDDASQAQVNAADPTGSTWLAANAGSGKTRVLTDRVARLLLRGADPQQILCLTYTKAAATEMQNRLFRRLGDWAMLPDEKLRTDLEALGVEGSLLPQDLARARTLFATAIETPGGLKIQTIHSFCASLLRRFPLEAGVNPLFEEMEDRAAELIQAQIVDEMIETGEAASVRDFLAHYTAGELPRMLKDIVRNKEPLNGLQSWPDISQRFQLEPDFVLNDLEKRVFLGGEAEMLERVIDKLEQTGGKTNLKISKDLRNVPECSMRGFEKLMAALFTAKLTPIKHLSNDSVQVALGEDHPPLMKLMDRLEDALEMKRRLNAAERTAALHVFAGSFLERYAKIKQTRGLLDFDDLILRTRDLLLDRSVAAWVLYRLDGGIRHVLVDEAQDTSPLQWHVIELLTQEFAAGLDPEDLSGHTLFVVGDKKQSIYSFQGADPNEFDRMEDIFAQRIRDTGGRFEPRSLEYSFRSSSAILKLVDATFSGHASAGFVKDQKHHAFDTFKPGRVDLWPLIPKAQEAKKEKWFDPVDILPAEHHTVLLANRIADEIQRMIDPGDPAFIATGKEGEARPVQPSDIMILVQRRSDLFHHIIRACKLRKLPIAGADRLRVGAQLAVRDLLALLSFLATPEDSLSLATVLRSPLGGWSERDLFQLAHNRSTPHLWAALRDRDTALTRMLTDLRRNIDFLRPYELIERVLTRFGGRESLIARLGKEAEDGIDALLGQALAYERSAIPSLTGFLRWAQASDLEIKRQVDSSGNLIRVMTVHGAKGLEAPIIVLPDCGKLKNEVKDDILNTENGLMWRTKSAAMPDRMRAAVDAKKEAQLRERQRLLYVAMTRAESWLIVAAAGDLNEDGSSWYSQVEAGLAQTDARECALPGGRGLRLERGNWDVTQTQDVPLESEEIPVLEPYFRETLSEHPQRSDPLSPTSLGGAKALPTKDGLPEDIAVSRGTYIHELLESYANQPDTRWEAHLSETPIPQILSDDIVSEAQEAARRVTGSADLSWVFEPAGLSEVDVTAKIEGVTFAGKIDRLFVDQSHVDIIDFKSNLTVPNAPEQIPEGVLRQLGAYLHMARQIYPNHEIRIGVLWTTGPLFMSVPHKLVIDAFARADLLDAANPAP